MKKQYGIKKMRCQSMVLIVASVVKTLFHDSLGVVE
jgi:hypothetical protein